MAADTNAGTILSSCLQSLSASRDEETIHRLTYEQFRTVISSCSKLSSGQSTLLPPCLADLAAVLLDILSRCELPFDNQIVASTAFCFTLQLIQEPLNVSLLFSKTFLQVNSEPFQVKLTKTTELLITVAKPELFKLCLCHGLLQLSESFWSSEHLNWATLMYVKMFPVMESHCFEYNQSTLLSFKCLHNWLRKVRTGYTKKSRQVPKDLMMRVMNVVVANWENPMNGVREQNSLVFEQLLGVADSPQNEDSAPFLKSASLLELVLTEQSWMMKSKYFMLSAILPKYGVLKGLLRNESDIVSGLLTSLCYTHLAPAGADLYRVCIDVLTQEHWETIFLQPITNILTTSKYNLQKQNIFNYWMQSTLKKFKKSLELILEKVVSSSADDGEILLPVICCLKLGRKEGVESMNWNSVSQSKYLHLALKHQDELIRSHAFSVVCISSKISIAPNDEEFSLVENFLVENVNSDCPALRQSLLTNFTTFLCRIRDACLHILKTKYHHEPSQFENRALTRSMIFLEWLYNFLKDNLEIGCNYQRKITSLEIYKLVLSYLSNDSVHTIQRKGNMKTEGYKVMKHAIAVGKWSFTTDSSREILLYCISDPSEDVRESAALILSTYFKFSDSENQRFNDLYKKALTLASDMMFYNMESGALLVQAVTHLVYKNGLGVKPLEPLFKEEKVTSHLLVLAGQQAAQLKADLLKAASQGSPLYGVLRSIHRLVSDKMSPEYKKLTQGEIQALISLVETTSQHLLQVLASKSGNLTDYAPSFSEMGEAIISTVEQSSVPVESMDNLQLSPAYQLVLNCIWLNLKVCCALCSSLVISGGIGVNSIEKGRCARVVCSVLRQCRHKGALEAAGGSLASMTKALTCQPYSDLADTILQESLSKLGQGNTVSMRGAGTVVLVHRLVANDSRNGKPMLTKAVQHLLNIVNTGEGDVPQALHILGVLVRDSSLSQDMAKHIHKIAVTCFETLSDCAWEIRNAALQLFGAIVPKVIGQRKRNEDDSDCSCYHLAYEELFYHATKLVSVLQQQLESAADHSQPDSARLHSKLVPALTLMSNLSVGVLTIIDRSLETVFHRFITRLQGLMSSRVYTVRKLSAKANAWFCSSSQLARLIQMRVWKIVAYVKDKKAENEIKSENDLHGFLMNTKYLYSRYMDEKEGSVALKSQSELVEQSIEELKMVREAKNISFLCKALLDDICGYDSSASASFQVESTLAMIAEKGPNAQAFVGIFYWASLKIESIIGNCPLNELIMSLTTTLNSGYYELHHACFRALKTRMSRPEFESILNPILGVLFRYSMNKIHVNESLEVFSVILEIFTKFESYSPNLKINNVIKTLSNEADSGTVQQRSLITPVLCGLMGLKDDIDIDTAEDIVFRLKENSDPSNNEDCRLNAAKGLNLITSLMLKPSTENVRENCVKFTLWEIASALLQDESLSVRKEASKFTSLILGASNTRCNPSVSLYVLHKTSFLKSMFPVGFALKCLWSRLKCGNEEFRRLEDEDLFASPFEAGSNVYEEQVKIADYANDSLTTLIGEGEEIAKALLKEEILPCMGELHDQCIKFLAFSSSWLVSNKILLNNEWYLISKKLSYQCKIISMINSSTYDKDIEMFNFRVQSYVEQLFVNT